MANKGSFLNSSNAFNDPPAGSGAVQSRRPFPRFGAIGFNSQDVSTTYHSLQVKAEKRLSTGLWYLVSYTFSKSLWHQNTPEKGGNTAWEKATSDFNIPHNFALSSGYELPFGKGRALAGGAGRLADGLIGGWQMQGILVLRSGRPFTPTISRDVANTGRGGQRPNRLASGRLDERTVDRWFDKSAFVLPPSFTYGNSGARLLQEDSLEFFDFSLFKEFRVRERSRLQFRAEFFNLTNTPNFNPPGTDIDTAAGGRVTSTSSTPRQIQFGLKYTF